METTAVELRAKYEGLVIRNEEDAKACQSYHLTAKANIKAIEAHMAPQIEEANQRHKTLTAKRNELTAPWKEIAVETDTKCREFTREQQRLAEEARQAEIKRQEEEKLAIAQAAQDMGEKELAKEIIEERIEVKAAPVFKLKKQRTTYKPVIVDLNTFLAGIISGKTWIPTLSDENKDTLLRGFRLNEMNWKPGDESRFPGLAVRETKQENVK